MKKIFCILSVLTIVSPVLADEISPTTNVVTTSYVQGAYNELNAAKQDNITVSQAAGAIVTAVSLNDDGKTVSVTRTNQVTIPVGSADNANRATIWIE